MDSSNWTPTAHISTTEREKYEAIRDVVSKYVGQLLYGCGHPRCTQALCATGRRNVTQKPVRDYTPRSARIIALTLASEARPRARLCQYFKDDRVQSLPEIKEGPQDPSSFEQQLVDTAAIRRLCRPSDQQWEKDEPYWDERWHFKDETLHKGLKTWPVVLDKLSREVKAAKGSTPADLAGGSKTLAETLAETLSTVLGELIATFPRDERRTEVLWGYVNRFVSAGCAYPAGNQVAPCDDHFNYWLRLLARLNHEPSFRLFRRAMEMVTAPEIVHNLANRLLETCSERVDRMCLMMWLKKSFLHYWKGETRFYEGTVPFTALSLLGSLYDGAAIGRSNNDDDDSVFRHFYTLSAVSANVEAEDMAQTFLETNCSKNSLHLLDCSRFLFGFNQKLFYFRTMNHLKMRTAHSNAWGAARLLAHDSRSGDIDPPTRLKYLKEHYLLLDVSRGNVLRDAFDQLWQRREGELHRPLRVRLGEIDTSEVGHDLGGVQIEFFNMVWKELMNPETDMFTTLTTGLSYFRPGSLQPRYMFELCGILFGLAVFNGITLPVSFPEAFYDWLLGSEPTMIQDGWPEAARSLQAIENGDADDVEPVYPFEAGGLRLSVDFLTTSERISTQLNVVEATKITHHVPTNSDGRGQAPEANPPNQSGVDIQSIADAFPGWKLVEATEPLEELNDSNRHAYVEKYAFWLTYASVGPQIRAFLKGFFKVIDDKTIQWLRPTELRSIVEGSNHLDINELREATTYDSFDPSSKYIQNFWRLVSSWPEEKQKQLIKFVTASERIPAGGAKNLTFRIQRQTPVSMDHLPTSSTCFGTLMLPKYSSVEILDQKLSLALKYGLEGFGQG